MLQVNLKKYKKIQNKSIPAPLRPKFRDKGASNMYFLSNKRFDDKKRKISVGIRCFIFFCDLLANLQIMSLSYHLKR